MKHVARNAFWFCLPYRHALYSTSKKSSRNKNGYIERGGRERTSRRIRKTKEKGKEDVEERGRRREEEYL
jgi:hypothetical protein